MDQAKRKKPKPREKGQDSILTDGLPHRFVHVAIGLLLIAAGLSKLSEFATQEDDVTMGSTVFMLFFEAEFLGGIALIAGLQSALAHRWAVAAFAGFAFANLAQILTGVCSCGCFGGLSISPWLALLLDLVAITALVKCRQPADPETAVSLNPLRSPGLAAIAIFVALAGWQQGASVALEGRATQNGQPLEHRDLVFTGDSGRLVSRTDADGRFRLPHIRPGDYVAALATHRGEQKTKSPASVLWIEASSCAEAFKDLEFSGGN